MTIRVEFVPEFPYHKSGEEFENMTHLRDFLKGTWFAPVYSIRTTVKDTGVVDRKYLLAKYSNGSESTLGEISFQ